MVDPSRTNSAWLLERRGAATVGGDQQTREVIGGQLGSLRQGQHLKDTAKLA